MTKDKLQQYIAMMGGALGGLYLALQASGIEVAFLNPDSLTAWGNFFTSIIPLVLVGYGIYKNTYLIKHKAKIQEEVLKNKGLK